MGRAPPHTSFHSEESSSLSHDFRCRLSPPISHTISLSNTHPLHTRQELTASINNKSSSSKLRVYR
ncbi:hypothetical protein U9M48_041374 [Paspalum notatum var. saurae]|uniref:Uncharacterized protein n=1 Tax=Paspalum notatum var. saurae TaxID=547442 RepID=A0AAQ3UNY6_PASNO